VLWAEKYRLGYEMVPLVCVTRKKDTICTFLRSEIMTETKEEINIARIVYEAYPHADLLPIDPEQDCRTLQTLLARVTGENVGDSLFKFMVVEIIEGGDSTLNGAIRVLEGAKADVEAVLQSLRLL
jgi:hypothetical protein